jgi:hypothetical protein
VADGPLGAGARVLVAAGVLAAAALAITPVTVAIGRVDALQGLGVNPGPTLLSAVGVHENPLARSQRQRALHPLAVAPVELGGEHDLTTHRRRLR